LRFNSVLSVSKIFAKLVENELSFASINFKLDLAKLVFEDDNPILKVNDTVGHCLPNVVVNILSNDSVFCENVKRFVTCGSKISLIKVWNANVNHSRQLLVNTNKYKVWSYN